MPIVPVQPQYKATFQRLLFNPLVLAKIVIKSFIKPNSKAKNINRTAYRREFYSDICNELGFKNVKCIPYNPYWKVNEDGPVENKLTLPVYRWYYNTFKAKKILSFKTSTMFDLCFLLYAEKQLKVDIAYIISHGFAARMVMQTNLLGRLVERGLKVALIAPDQDDENLKKYCSDNKIELHEFKHESSFPKL